MKAMRERTEGRRRVDRPEAERESTKVNRSTHRSDPTGEQPSWGSSRERPAGGDLDR